MVTAGVTWYRPFAALRHSIATRQLIGSSAFHDQTYGQKNASLKHLSTANSTTDFQETPEEKRERVEWLNHFKRIVGLDRTQSKTDRAALFPRQWIATSFSRSSGPGGQNVNKVNTKADVRLSLHAAAASAPATAGSASDGKVPGMPRPVVRYLVHHSRFYVSSSHTIHMTASDSRSQSDNLDSAFARLTEHLTSLLQRDVEGETSAEQRQKVRHLIALDKQRTRRQKEKRRDVKSSRRTLRGDGSF